MKTGDYVYCVFPHISVHQVGCPLVSISVEKVQAISVGDEQVCVPGAGWGRSVRFVRRGLCLATRLEAVKAAAEIIEVCNPPGHKAQKMYISVAAE